MCLAGSDLWSNPLEPESLPNDSQMYRYGGIGQGAVDMFTIPLASLIDHSHDTGVSDMFSIPFGLL